MFPKALSDNKNMGYKIWNDLISYAEVYDTWLMSMDALVNENFEFGKKVVRGENPEPERFLQSSRDAYNNVMSSIIMYMENIHPEVTEEYKNRDISNISSGFLKNWISFSSEACNRIIDGYSNFSNYFIGLSPQNTPRLIKYEDAVDNTTVWIKKNNKIAAYWLKVNLKMHREETKFVINMYDLIQEMSEKDDSIETFYKKWFKVYEDTRISLIKDSHRYIVISEFLDKKRKKRHHCKMTLNQSSNQSSNQRPKPLNILIKMWWLGFVKAETCGVLKTPQVFTVIIKLTAC